MNTKHGLIPLFALTVAAALAVLPQTSQARPIKPGAAAFLQPQDQKPPDKPDENPAAKPAKPDKKAQDSKDNPPAHEPDKTKPAQNQQPQQNPPEKNEKAPKQEKPDKNAKEQENKGNKQGAHAHQNVHYSFRSQDKTTLKQHFSSQLRSVNRSNRPSIRVGGVIPVESVTYIQPVPVEVITLLPPVPEGCLVGFWDGYIIVYYPDDYYIVAYIDLL
jgi:hypothetical protein